MKHYLVVFVLLAIVAGVAQAHVPFWDIGRNMQCGWTRHAGVVIRTQEQLEFMWAVFYSHSLYPPEVPVVDFEKVMWVCAFRGQFPTWGYTTEIQRIYKIWNTALVVVVLELNPPCWVYVKQEFTQPFHIIELERSELPVRFTYKERVRLR